MTLILNGVFEIDARPENGEKHSQSFFYFSFSYGELEVCTTTGSRVTGEGARLRA